jgi:hypothetical protein
VFDPLTHRADFELTFSFWKGFKLPPDSTFVVAYYAYTDDTLSVVRRTMRYKKLYPQLDSFDIKVESSPMGKCLIDVENRCAYKYNEYSNQYFDLVYVNELESDFRFGTGLVSPNAVYLMRYFQRRFPSLPYDPAKRRSTECGLISNTVNKTYSWLDFSNEMLGDNDNWVTYDRIGALPPQDGVGIIDLQMDKLMKFRLESGDLIMVRVLERNSLESADNSSVKLRIYYQK